MKAVEARHREFSLKTMSEPNPEPTKFSAQVQEKHLSRIKHEIDQNLTQLNIHLQTFCQHSETKNFCCI